MGLCGSRWNRGWTEYLPQVSFGAGVFVFSCLVHYRHFTGCLLAIPDVTHHLTERQWVFPDVVWPLWCKPQPTPPLFDLSPNCAETPPGRKCRNHGDPGGPTDLEQPPGLPDTTGFPSRVTGGSLFLLGEERGLRPPGPSPDPPPLTAVSLERGLG